MASIATIQNRNGSKSYRVTWRTGDSENGGRRQEYRTFAVYDEAKAYKQAMGEIESRRIGGPKAQSVHGYLDLWLEGIDRRVGRDDLSPKTGESYRRNLGIAKRFLKDERLSRLNRIAINRAYDKMLEQELSRQTVVHIHRVLNAALSDAVKDRFISENPASFATPPKAGGKKYKTKVRSYTKAEVDAQLDLAQTNKRYNDDLYLIVLVLVICGLRRGELCGLAFDAIDFETGKVSVFRQILEVNNEIVERETPKTDASIRTISIPADLVELLKVQHKRVLVRALEWGKDYQRQPLYVFPGAQGRPMQPRQVTRRLEGLAVKAKVDMTHISPVHSWRHTSGSLLWAATLDVKAVQERLGHSNPAITAALYIHNAPTADEAAAEALGKIIK